MKQLIILFLFFIIIFCVIKHFYSTKEEIDLSTNEIDLIVSLTSTPERINDSKRTILSILKQTYLPKEIIFNIPYFSSKNVEYKIPEWLLRLSKKYPVIKINRCEKDYGPATKIIPTLLLHKYNPEQKILYIDDDMIYHRNFIKHFYESSLEHEDEVICYNGYNIENYKYIKNNGPLFLTLIFLGILTLFLISSYLILKSNWKIFILIYVSLLLILYYICTKNDVVDVVEGWAGVLVKPKFFNLHKLLQFEQYPKEVFFDDDVYLSGHLAENNIKKCIIKFFGVPLPTFHKNFFKTLSFSSNSDNQNKKISHSCFKWNQ
jgi:hypothetical protein